MTQLTEQLLEVLASDHPQSTRHLFYRMTDPRLPEPVDKSDAGYTAVQRLLVKLRRDGTIPYGWISDATRRGYFVETWRSPADALAQTAQFYRRSYWATSAAYVEVWVSGGFASLTLAYEAAANINHAATDRPVKILYIGDLDPAGVLIDRKIEAELRRHLPDADIAFRRLGITREQADLMRLPTKPAKDRRGGFQGDTVEAEAMPAGLLRRILCNAIEGYIDPHEAAALEAAEASERSLLLAMAASLEASP